MRFTCTDDRQFPDILVPAITVERMTGLTPTAKDTATTHRRRRPRRPRPGTPGMPWEPPPATHRSGSRLPYRTTGASYHRHPDPFPPTGYPPPSSSRPTRHPSSTRPSSSDRRQGRPATAASYPAAIRVIRAAGTRAARLRPPRNQRAGDRVAGHGARRLSVLHRFNRGHRVGHRCPRPDQADPPRRLRPGRRRHCARRGGPGDDSDHLRNALALAPLS